MKSILRKIAGLAVDAALALGMIGCPDGSSNPDLQADFLAFCVCPSAK